ncbi:MAG: hypothetical protein M3Y59_03800 [Myxococcota bacterium]|nr:hypothetical protein [Myxococcota bacterium]
MDQQPQTALREKTSRSSDEARRAQVAAVKAMAPLDRVALALSLGKRDALLREKFRVAKSFGL